MWRRKILLASTIFIISGLYGWLCYYFPIALVPLFFILLLLGGVHDNEGSDNEHNNALANHNQQNSSPNGFHEERAIQSTNKEITRSAIIRLLPPVKSFLDDENNKDYCPICLERFKKGVLIQPFRVCNHEFHVSCLFLWLHDQGKTTCPVCRQDL
jgi:hypothetical protein